MLILMRFKPSSPIRVKCEDAIINTYHTVRVHMNVITALMCTCRVNVKENILIYDINRDNGTIARG